MNELASIRRLLKVLIAVVFVSLAIISAAAVVATRTSENVQEISENNQRLNEENKKNSEALLKNFTTYMSCLVLRDQALYDRLGRDTYIKRCNELLFEGAAKDPPKTEDIPKPSDPVPSDVSSTTTTTLEG